MARCGTLKRLRCWGSSESVVLYSLRSIVASCVVDALRVAGEGEGGKAEEKAMPLGMGLWPLDDSGA